VGVVIENNFGVVRSRSRNFPLSNYTNEGT
jgi:hypothetical protein